MDTTLIQSNFGNGSGNPCANGGANAENTVATVADLSGGGGGIVGGPKEVITNNPRSPGDAIATGNNATAVGQGSVADRDNSVSMGVVGGERQVTNLAAGAAGTDAVNVAQLNSANANTLNQANNYTDAKTANVVQYDVDASGNRTNSVTLAGGSSGPVTIHNVATGIADTDAVNVAQLNTATANTLNEANSYTDSKTKYFKANSTLANAQASGAESVAIGGNAVASAPQTVAIGSNSAATGDNAIAIGYGAQATGSVAVGTLASAGQGGTAVGDNTSAVGENTLAAGTGATANVARGVALGNNASVTVNDSVALGANAVASRGAAKYFDPVTGLARTSAGEVSIGAAGAERQITSVADGHKATDAVNLRQLQAMGANAQTYVDNRVAVNNTGNLPAPVAPGSNSVALGPGSVADRPNSVSVGSAGNARQITNVAAGTAPTDAANVGQLNALSDRTQRMVGAVGAMGAAMAAMQPNARAEGPLSISVGAGTNGGIAALAAGINYYASNRVLLNLKASTAIGAGLSASQTVSVGVGATFGF
ncbi:hypothetical protein OR16_04242 [Cupriavidus basilensis OR16]|uniref:Uncharacterized protein n=1 Tax=Cupriavidus basilensis OR16 TaxID=1127483 RepID=H1RZU2_9BURK|nr:hypothetical protein OR16_04242 [Cupriavidus basilensis OR16]